MSPEVFWKRSRWQAFVVFAYSAKSEILTQNLTTLYGCVSWVLFLAFAWGSEPAVEELLGRAELCCLHRACSQACSGILVSESIWRGNLRLTSRMQCPDLVVCCSKSPGVYAVEWGQRPTKKPFPKPVDPWRSRATGEQLDKEVLLNEPASKRAGRCLLMLEFAMIKPEALGLCLSRLAPLQCQLLQQAAEQDARPPIAP